MRRLIKVNGAYTQTSCLRIEIRDERKSYYWKHVSCLMPVLLTLNLAQCSTIDVYVQNSIVNTKWLCLFKSYDSIFCFLFSKILKTYRLIWQINQTQVVIVLSCQHVSNSSFGKYVANLRSYMMPVSFNHIVLDPTKHTAWQNWLSEFSTILERNFY